LANWELGSYDEALSDYLEAIKLNPLNAIALRGAGEMLVRRNKIDDAIAYFERALLINTNYINAYRSVGIACYKAGDFARSQKALKEVLRLKPDDEVAQRGITKLLEE
jgi:tetratricopeptide (TPR) repeat protein